MSSAPPVTDSQSNVSTASQQANQSSTSTATQQTSQTTSAQANQNIAADTAVVFQAIGTLISSMNSLNNLLRTFSVDVLQQDLNKSNYYVNLIQQVNIVGQSMADLSAANLQLQTAIARSKAASTQMSGDTSIATDITAAINTASQMITTTLQTVINIIQKTTSATH